MKKAKKSANLIAVIGFSSRASLASSGYYKPTVLGTAPTLVILLRSISVCVSLFISASKKRKQY